VTDESTGTGGGAETDSNDYRVTVQLEEAGHAVRASTALKGHDAEREVQQRLGGRVMVGTDGGSELFLYAHSKDAAAAAQQSVGDLLASHGLQAEYSVQRWHPIAEEWEPADVALPDTPAEVQAEHKELDAEETKESLTAGVALFEVRVQVPSHHDSVALAERLKGEGYSVVRRWRFLVVGANNEDQVAEFATKIKQEAPAGSVITTEEVGPARPYTVFEIAAGSGL
jgi:hypothetical protein